MIKAIAYVEFDPVALLLGNGSKIDLVEEVANRLYEDTGDRDSLRKAFPNEKVAKAFDGMRYTDELKPYIKVEKEKIFWDKEDTSMMGEVTLGIPYLFNDEKLAEDFVKETAYALVVYDFQSDTRCGHVHSVYKSKKDARKALNELAKYYFDELDVTEDYNGEKYNPDPDLYPSKDYSDEVLFETDKNKVSICVDEVKLPL